MPCIYLICSQIFWGNFTHCHLNIMWKMPFCHLVWWNSFFSYSLSKLCMWCLILFMRAHILSKSKYNCLFVIQAMVTMVLILFVVTVTTVLLFFLFLFFLLWKFLFIFTGPWDFYFHFNLKLILHPQTYFISKMTEQ